MKNRRRDFLFYWAIRNLYFLRYPGHFGMLKKKAKKTRFQLFHKKIPENEKFFERRKYIWQDQEKAKH
jgi:hypothetical protein|nr:MAG TPA: hypothetical protein [Caudoviricetes sp.]